MVISSEGLFQAYNIDLENGGECSLMKEFASVVYSLPVIAIWESLTFLVYIGYWAVKISEMDPMGFNSHSR